MNKKGFIDIDDFEPAMIILPVIGFIVAFFTASGGFFGDWSAGNEPSIFYKLFISFIGAIAGFVIAWVWGER